MKRPARRPRRGRLQFKDLKTYIEETGDTQARIAAALGITQVHVSRLVRGVAVPRPETAVKLAAYACVPLDSFQRVYLEAKKTGGSK